MESSTSNYLSTLHDLLHKLSSEVYGKNSTGSYPNIHSFNNSKHLISAIQEVDSFIRSADRSLNESGEFPEDVSKSMTNALSSHLQLFVNGYAISTVAGMGLIINLIGIILLSTGSRCDKVLNLLVACRLSFDVSFLLFESLKSLKIWLIFIPRKYVKAYSIVVGYGARFSMISSILLLVTISRARLCAIRNPLQHNPLSWKGRRNYCFRSCISIIILSMVLSVPFCLEIGDELANSNDPDLVVPKTYIQLHPFLRLLNAGILNLGSLGLIPMTYFAYLMHHIRRELKKDKEQRETLGGRQGQNNNHEESNEDKNTKGLLAILIASMILHALRVLIALYEFDLLLFHYNVNSALRIRRNESPWITFSHSTNDLLLVINASINVIIYFKPNSKELLDTFIPARREQSNRLRFTEMYQNRHQRNILEKTESVDTVISMVDETNLVAQVEINPAGRANAEMETGQKIPLRRRSTLETIEESEENIVNV